MRILYDGHIYAQYPAGGVAKYFDNLVSRLPLDFDPALLVGEVLNSNYPRHPNLKVYEYDKWHQILTSHRLSLYYSRLRNHLLRNALIRKHFDVLHPTYYTRVTSETYGSPIVITVWDMIHELFPSELDPNGDFAELKRKAILAAQKVICISENTKKDLLERYKIPEGKVFVTLLASDIDETLSYGPEPVPSRPYYLHVGRRAFYKNFDGLLKAFAKAVSVRPELALCVVGIPFSEAENSLIRGLKLTEQIEHYGYATDSHLAKLYRCSLALVYPSLYEGFGLPPLEAMSCGTVVVASRTSSLPEVVGEAGLLYDPKSNDELIAILITLMDDPGREALIRRGQRRAKEFSWDKTAAKTVEIYRSVGK